MFHLLREFVITPVKSLQTIKRLISNFQSDFESPAQNTKILDDSCILPTAFMSASLEDVDDTHWNKLKSY